MKIPSKVAIVTDSLLDLGGADRVLFTLLKVFPKAVVYTSKYNPDKYPQLKNIDVRTSFMQHWFFKLPIMRHANPMTTMAFEQFDMSGYDLIISISAGSAKGIIPKIDQTHIAYIFTPPRNLWDGDLNVRGKALKKLYAGQLSHLFLLYMRMWDVTVMKRIKHVVAITEYIQEKIELRYQRESTVIYPGLTKEAYKQPTSAEIDNVKKKYNLPKEFMLVVGRLYQYKQVERAIYAAIKTNENLVIVGDGPDMKYLRGISKGYENIEFLGHITDDSEVKVMFKLAKLFIFCGEEDYGITPLESMAMGTPVFAYNKGGVKETVIKGKTGDFFNTNKELVSLIKQYDKKKYNEKDIVNRAKQFTEEKFISNLKSYIEDLDE
jgi:glycosyltransferase involved in cell wall biosynthesis